MARVSARCSGLVSQRMAWLGLVGGPLIIASGTAVIFGVDHPGGALQGIAMIPEFLWELSLAVYCTLKGFKPSAPILRADARGDRAATMPAVAPARADRPPAAAGVSRSGRFLEW